MKYDEHELVKLKQITMINYSIEIRFVFDFNRFPMTVSRQFGNKPDTLFHICYLLYTFNCAALMRPHNCCHYTF